MLFVFVMGAGAVFLNHKAYYNRKTFLMLAFSSMAILVGLRGEKTGEDTLHYLNVFLLIKNSRWDSVLTAVKGFQINEWGESVEYLYALINKIVAVFVDNGQVLLFLVALLTMWLFARFIYRNIPEHAMIATTIFMCNGLFMDSFNGIRQMLAIAIIINAYEYYVKKDIKKVLGLTIIAFFTHMSSIMMVPFFMFFVKGKNDKNKVFFVIALCVSAIIMRSFIPQLIIRMFPVYAPYISNNYWHNSYRGIIIVWIIEIILMIFMLRTNINQRELVGIVGTMIYITLAVVSVKVYAISRLMMYFNPFSIILFSYGADRFSFKSKKIYYAGLFAIMLLEFLSYARVPTRDYSFFWMV